MEPELYFYELGYLSLRPCLLKNDLSLDYPNTEVLNSIAFCILRNYYDSASVALGAIRRLLNALSHRDPEGLISEFNTLLSKLPYYDFKEGKLMEGQYRRDIYTLFYGAGLDPHAEIHGNLGRTDVYLTHGGQSWVLELKTSKKERTDESLAREALEQIRIKNYGGAYSNPVRLGLVINEKERIIKAWKCEGGLMSKPKEKKTTE
jgi:hypothetical protein